MAHSVYSSSVALVFCIIILLTGGFRVFTKGNWDANSFVSSYLDIPLVIAAYTIWKLVKKTKLVRLDEIPLQEAVQQAEERLEIDEERSSGWVRIVSWIWD